jgi:hypothetical protein
MPKKSMKERIVNPNINAFQIINIVTYGVIIIINVISQLGVIGETNVAVSDKFPSYFTPAGYTFAIWGIIFAGLGAFTIYQALPRNNDNPKIRQIHILFMLSGVGMIGWIFSFNLQVIWLSQIFIFGNWLALAILYFRMIKFSFLKPPKFGSLDYWLIDVPFSIYFGWLTLANIANFFIVSVDQGWAVVNTPLSASIAIAIVTAGGLALLACYTDIFFVIVVFWAVMGIRVKQISTEEIAITTLTCFIVLVAIDAAAFIASMILYFKNRGQKKKNKVFDEEKQSRTSQA